MKFIITNKYLYQYINIYIKGVYKNRWNIRYKLSGLHIMDKYKWNENSKCMKYKEFKIAIIN